MDPVNGINQLVQILRQKMFERSSNVERDKTHTTSTSASPQRTETRASIDETRRMISDRVKALSDEEASGPKGAQIFVEAVMAWEFGDELLRDHQFAELSRDIVDTMSENPAVWHQMQEMLSALKRE